MNDNGLKWFPLFLLFIFIAIFWKEITGINSVFNIFFEDLLGQKFMYSEHAATFTACFLIIIFAYIAALFFSGKIKAILNEIGEYFRPVILDKKYEYSINELENDYQKKETDK